MKYIRTTEGRFIERPNRFVARVEIGGKEETVHVKNTGRCRELLIPGAKVYLEDFEGRMGSRKTRYSLIGVNKNGIMINMDSQAPNQVVKEALMKGQLLLPDMEQLVHVKGERIYGNSRLDFYVEDEKRAGGFVEVKGVTLEERGIARFPDAPTERGVRHIQELIHARSEGYGAWLIFLIQMKGVLWMEPNDETHPSFGESLRKAYRAGVQLLAYDCRITGDSIEMGNPVEIRLE